MGAKQKPKREHKKPEQSKAHADHKVVPSPDFEANIIRKGWHLSQRGTV